MLLKYNHDIVMLLTMHVTVVKLFINDITASMPSSLSILANMSCSRSQQRRKNWEERFNRRRLRLPDVTNAVSLNGNVQWRSQGSTNAPAKPTQSRSSHGSPYPRQRSCRENYQSSSQFLGRSSQECGIGEEKMGDSNFNTSQSFLAPSNSWLAKQTELGDQNALSELDNTLEYLKNADRNDLPSSGVFVNATMFAAKCDSSNWHYRASHVQYTSFKITPFYRTFSTYGYKNEYFGNGQKTLSQSTNNLQLHKAKNTGDTMK